MDQATEVRSKAPATYRDLFSLPHTEMGQIVRGELIITPRPPLRHVLVSSLLGGELCERFDRGRGGPGGWWILDEPDLQIGNDVLVADMAGWRRSRMEQLPRVFPVSLAPDWVGEVLWPGTSAIDRVWKLPLYAQAGVEYVWLLDPSERSVEIYQLHEGHFRLVDGHVGDGPGKIAPFEAVELRLGRYWPPPER